MLFNLLHFTRSYNFSYVKQLKKKNLTCALQAIQSKACQLVTNLKTESLRKVLWLNRSKINQLILFSFDLDPTIRHTFWTTSIGNYFGWLASSTINQAMVQRCLAMPSLFKAKMYEIININSSILINLN